MWGNNFWATCHGLAEIQSDILTRCSINIGNAFIYNINSPISIHNCPILNDSHHQKVPLFSRIQSNISPSNDSDTMTSSVCILLESSGTSRDRSTPCTTGGALSRPRWPHPQSLACWGISTTATDNIGIRDLNLVIRSRVSHADHWCKWQVQFNAFTNKLQTHKKPLQIVIRFYRSM